MKNERKRTIPSVVYRARDVQELYMHHKRPGVTHVGVWRNHIYPEFKISLRTMERYLNRNVKREIRLLEEDSPADVSVGH